MDPLNKKERKLAIWQFALLYGVSLLIPFGAAAFLFSTPTAALENENERLRTAFAEQVKLNARLETMVKRLARLDADDKAYLGSANDLDKGNLKSSIDESENMIRAAVYDLKRDTAEFKQDSTRLFARNVLTVVDASLNYRNTIAYLRQALEKNGINTQEIDKITVQLKEKDQIIRTLELENRLLAASKPAPTSSGGTAKKEKDSDCSLYISRLQTADDEINNLKSRLKSLTATTNAGSNTTSVNEAVVRDKVTGEFIDLLVRTGDDSKKTPCARKPMYELAIETLTKTSKPESKNKIDELRQKIRKISD